MKSVAQVLQIHRGLKASIEELEGQREHNASEGNWPLVKAIKDMIRDKGRELRTIERILDPEDFMDTGS